MSQQEKAKEWCRKQNLKLVRFFKDGFIYMCFGEDYYMPFNLI